MKLELAFRLLRDAWFREMLNRPAHEREWETVEQEQRREEQNAQLLSAYEIQTQEILDGIGWPICPRCPADLLHEEDA